MNFDTTTTNNTTIEIEIEWLICYINEMHVTKCLALYNIACTIISVNFRMSKLNAYKKFMTTSTNNDNPNHHRKHLWIYKTLWL